MSKSAPWSVKGVDREARELARGAAQEAGLTIGAWLERAIRHSDRLLTAPPEAPALPAPPAPAEVAVNPVIAAAERAGFNAIADDLTRAEERLARTVVPVALKVQEVARRLVDIEKDRDRPVTPASAPKAAEPVFDPDRPASFPRMVSKPAGPPAADAGEADPDKVLEQEFPSLRPRASFEAELERARQQSEPADATQDAPPSDAEPERRPRRVLRQLKRLAACLLALALGATGGWGVLAYGEDIGLPPLGPPVAAVLRDTVDQAVVLLSDWSGAWLPQSSSTVAVEPSTAAPPTSANTSSAAAGASPTPPSLAAIPVACGSGNTGSAMPAEETKAAVIEATPTQDPEPTVRRLASRTPPAKTPPVPAQSEAGAGSGALFSSLNTSPSLPGSQGAAGPPASLEALQMQARQGVAGAQHDLAVIYARGDLGSPDYAKSAYWFREAAVQGLANAQYNLGVLYEQGLGVSQDDVRALLWYHSAAEQGHARAQFNLGVFYADGRGLPVDYVESAKWLHLAADQGIARAFYNLAILNERGLGTPANPTAARAYLSRAALLGDTDARRRLTGAEATPAPATAMAAGNAEAKTAGPELVGAIQHLLGELKLEPGRADGVLGERTRQAIRRFEADAGLPVTGLPSESLLDQLMARLNRQSATSTE